MMMIQAACSGVMKEIIFNLLIKRIFNFKLANELFLLGVIFATWQKN
jgi:hypothetical protein